MAQNSNNNTQTLDLCVNRVLSHKIFNYRILTKFDDGTVFNDELKVINTFEECVTWAITEPVLINKEIRFVVPGVFDVPAQLKNQFSFSGSVSTIIFEAVENGRVMQIKYSTREYFNNDSNDYIDTINLGFLLKSGTVYIDNKHVGTFEISKFE